MSVAISVIHISVVRGLSPGPGYVQVGNYEYDNTTYTKLTKEWVPVLIASAPPNGNVSAVSTTQTSFSWNIAGNGESVIEGTTFSHTATNNEIEITYDLVYFYYTDVKVDSFGSWNDLGTGLFPQTTAGFWSMDANPSGTNHPQNSIYTINYTPPQTPNINQYAALPIQPYIGFYTGAGNTIVPEYCTTSSPCPVTQSDSTDLTNGLAISISVSIKFDVGSVGISIPISIESGVGSTDSATYYFAGNTNYEADWVNGVSHSITGYYIFQPTYYLEFTEQGKPSGVQWTVVVNGHNYSTTGTAITISDIDAGYSYSYTVNNFYYGRTLYHAYPSSGSGTVNGNTYIQISFSPYFVPEG